MGSYAMHHSPSSNAYCRRPTLLHLILLLLVLHSCAGCRIREGTDTITQEDYDCMQIVNRFLAISHMRARAVGLVQGQDSWEQEYLGQELNEEDKQSMVLAVLNHDASNRVGQLKDTLTTSTSVKATINSRSFLCVVNSFRGERSPVAAAIPIFDEPYTIQAPDEMLQNKNYKIAVASTVYQNLNATSHQYPDFAGKVVVPQLGCFDYGDQEQYERVQQLVGEQGSFLNDRTFRIPMELQVAGETRPTEYHVLVKEHSKHAVHDLKGYILSPQNLLSGVWQEIISDHTFWKLDLRDRLDFLDDLNDEYRDKYWADVDRSFFDKLRLSYYVIQNNNNTDYLKQQFIETINTNFSSQFGNVGDNQTGILADTLQNVSSVLEERFIIDWQEIQNELPCTKDPKFVPDLSNQFSEQCIQNSIYQAQSLSAVRDVATCFQHEHQDSRIGRMFDCELVQPQIVHDEINKLEDTSHYYIRDKHQSITQAITNTEWVEHWIKWVQNNRTFDSQYILTDFLSGNVDEKQQLVPVQTEYSFMEKGLGGSNSQSLENKTGIQWRDIPNLAVLNANDREMYLIELIQNHEEALSLRFQMAFKEDLDTGSTCKDFAKWVDVATFALATVIAVIGTVEAITQELEHMLEYTYIRFVDDNGEIESQPGTASKWIALDALLSTVLITVVLLPFSIQANRNFRAISLNKDYYDLFGTGSEDTPVPYAWLGMYEALHIRVECDIDYPFATYVSIVAVVASVLMFQWKTIYLAAYIIAQGTVLLVQSLVNRIFGKKVGNFAWNQTWLTLTGKDFEIGDLVAVPTAPYYAGDRTYVHDFWDDMQKPEQNLLLWWLPKIVRGSARVIVWGKEVP